MFAGPGSSITNSMKNRIALVATCIVLIGAMAAIIITISPGNQRQSTENLAARVVAMNNWHFKGSAARKDMQRFFDRENFNAEAKHFDHFVQSHPFFGEGNMYDLPQDVRLPKKFRVAGFPSQNEFYHGKRPVRHLIRLHPAFEQEGKVNHVPRMALVRRG